MRDSWRHFAAEFIGIFALVFVGGAAIMTTQMARTDNVLLAVAAAHGIALAVMVTATMRISGHLNPAVTLGFLAARRIEPMMAMLFIVAQLLGATLAAYALLWIFPHEAALGARLGGQSLALEQKWLPPTLNLDSPDPVCDLDYIPKVGRDADVEYALSNSFGFGGINAAVVLKRHDGV